VPSLLLRLCLSRIRDIVDDAAEGIEDGNGFPALPAERDEGQREIRFAVTRDFRRIHRIAANI
jgi:hypothetical protein